MATGLSIKQITNNLDGSTAQVVLSGVADGDVTFQASRTPDMSNPITVDATLVTGLTYDVTLPAPVLWYISAADTAGSVVQPRPVWCSASNDGRTTQLGNKLQSILQANQEALDIALQQFFNLGPIKQIVYGQATQVKSFPAILITKPQRDPNYATYAWGKLNDWTFEIYAMILHQDPTPYLNASTDFMDRVIEILGQPAYSRLTLPDGTIVAFAQAKKGEADDVLVDEHANKWAAVGSVVWTGNALIIDSYGAPT